MIRTQEQDILSEPSDDTSGKFFYVWTIFRAKDDTLIPILQRRRFRNWTLVLK